MKEEKFRQWFKTLGIKHFTADEFINYFYRSRNGVRNSFPPEAIWPNIVPALRLVDDLRGELGTPIVLLSSYRSKAYNSAVGGEKASFHMQFLALDIASATHSPYQVHKILRAWRTAGRFKGGLGLYPTFVHIDTRGYNANW